MIKNIKLLALVSITFIACTTDEETPVVSNSSDGQPLTAGSADFTKYVAIGDSFAAGFSDGALFIEGQKGSYPNLLAQQFAQVGGGAFIQPLMKDNIGGFLGSTMFTQRLYFNGVVPTPVTEASTTPITEVLTGAFNNYGIPGAKSFHLLAPGYGNFTNLSLGTANPYFVRMASSPNKTVLEDALSQNPTFFSLWIGGNDELGYATDGGDTVLNALTPAIQFNGYYNSILTQLTAGGRKGVIANLPYVTSLPYFYVIKYNQLTQANLTVSGVNQVNALNTQLYGPLKNALTFLGQGDRIELLSATGNNPMLMVDETLPNISANLAAVITGGLLMQGVPQQQATDQGNLFGLLFGQARQTKSTDLICLKASSRIGMPPNVLQDGIASPSPLINQLGVTFPLPDRYVLLPSEVQEIKDATDAYNVTIETAATTYNLALVDAKKLMQDVSTNGVSNGGYTVTSTFVTGGAFSLDGIHPSPRGYALIANAFSNAINAKYGSNFKDLDFSKFRIMFPKTL